MLRKAFHCLQSTYWTAQRHSHYPQAEARQAKFEQSAGGKAAMKSVKAVKAEREAFKRQQESKDTAGDWLS